MWEVNDRVIYLFCLFDDENCTRYCNFSWGNNKLIKVLYTQSTDLFLCGMKMRKMASSLPLCNYAGNSS